MLFFKLIFPKKLFSFTQTRLFYGFLLICVAVQVIFWLLFRRFDIKGHIRDLEILEVYKQFIYDLNERAEIDDSGNYRILYSNYISMSSSDELTLVTQCSINNLFDFSDAIKVWNGPISIAVFTDDFLIENTLWEMARFTLCFKFKDLYLHLVVSTESDIFIKNFELGYKMYFDSNGSVLCNPPKSLEKMKNYAGSSPYPSNLLRNIAKKGSKTKYILVIDIDMIPSRNLFEDFINFLKYRRPYPDEQEVYIVPVFEMPLNVPVPINKVELKRRISFNHARPFYLEPCRKCQKLTRYSDWLSSKSTKGIKVLYEVQWRHPYEPFFIAKRSMPDFDVRFKQYGMNRVSQICELYVAGYKFLVLDNAFLVHKGFKTTNGFHSSKKKEMIQNKRLYAQFKEELTIKYPLSYRTC